MDFSRYMNSFLLLDKQLAIYYKGKVTKQLLLKITHHVIRHNTCCFTDFSQQMTVYTYERLEIIPTKQE